MIKEALLLDYGCGNHWSLRSWIRGIGLDCWLIDQPSDFKGLTSSSILVLPGVGHFGHAMQNLKHSGLQRELDSVLGEVPVLGICLGAQIMFESSEEAPYVDGLGWLKGACVRLPARENPRLGWYGTRHYLGQEECEEANQPKMYYYYNHCYHIEIDVFDRNSFESASVCRNSLASFRTGNGCAGSQFHPERSQGEGKTYIRNLLDTLEIL